MIHACRNEKDDEWRKLYQPNAAVPSPESLARRLSNSMSASSQWDLLRTGTEDPPGIQEREESHPLCIPPQCYSTSSWRRMDMVSLTTMGFLTCLEIPKSLVPRLFSFPNPVNHSAAMVSTLVIVEGQPKRPTPAGIGGLRRGFPCLPSKLSIKAVSSPQIYAPAPRCKNMSKS